MPEHCGYALEALRQNAEFTLYRGQRDGEASRVLVVALAAEQPSPQSLRQLQHEYSLAAHLDPEWAARPLEVTRRDGRTMLLLKDPGGEPLDRILDRSKGQPLELSRALRIGVGLATALGQVHRHGLIHKDIKPANVLVDDAGKVWLTGFGIASLLPRESQAPAPPEVIAGTLPYMAPEQTGRMNRSIDARSDLYSLGVTLYQMLTGTLPFAAADPLEWVHCHIAREPMRPGDRADVPDPLSSLTMKLLAKNAEERYQTASGLEADLRLCLAEWESQGRICPFPLGAHDASDRLLIPEKLYGREREIEALLAAFDRVVAHSASELVLVSGYSGVGKSSVVNELHKVLVLPRGLFASGKFDQYKRDIPYATLAQAFQTLVRQILVKSQADVDKWRSALTEAVGPNGQLIINLIPEVEFLIGKQPAVPDLAPQDAQNRFKMVFRRFVGAFARPEHPLALFLDDLQWLDSATLELLEHLTTDPDVRHVMLVGAYRDNEVSPSHPLTRTLEAIRKTNARVQEIVLAPLRLDDIARLVADALHCELDSARPLAELVHEKTGGNPFFTIQFLTTLAEEGLLAFHPEAGTWAWDLARIRAKGYTGNVVDLLVRKLKGLSDASQYALQQLACLGNVVEIATLTLLHGESEEEIHTPLWDAIRAGLILRLEDSYAFLHDRVQEAAYTLISEGERAATHLRIGRVLASGTAPAEIEEKIFEIVNQFDRGAALIDLQDEREQVAELNLVAGKRAKVSTAYSSALAYLAAGRALLTDASWDHNYELVFALEYHMAECEFLTTDMAAAEARLTMLSQRARGVHHIAAVTRLRLELYTTLDRSDRGVEVCLEYLQRDGASWPAHPSSNEVRREYDRVWSQLGTRSIEELIDLPLMDDPDSLAALEVQAAVLSAATFTDQNLGHFVICRMVSLSLERGNTDASCFAYVLLGIVVGARFGDYKAGFRFGQLGYDLGAQRGMRRFQTRVEMCFGYFVLPWTRHVRRGLDLGRRAFDAALRMGDLTYACFCRSNLTTSLLVAGDPLAEVQREAEIGVEFAQKARFGLMTDVTMAQLRLILTLRGLTPEFGSFNDEQFDELRFEHHLSSHPSLVFSKCWYFIRKLQARFFAEDYASAIDASLNARDLIWTSLTNLEHAEYHFYSALGHAALYDSASHDSRREHLEALAAHHRQLEVWADNCPENFGDRAALVAAEAARLDTRDLDAMRLYERAIRLAREHGFVQNEGLAHELAARFYLTRGLETVGLASLRSARNCYDRWGALGKVKQLDERYPDLHQERDPDSLTDTIGTPVGQLDVATVVKASQALSSEILLPRLIERLMRIAVEHAGAERGLLILLQGGTPRIEAEAVTGHDRIRVTVRQAAITASDLPQSALNFVIRTQEGVVLNDALVANPYSEDEYVLRKRPRSVLCLPIVKHTRPVGALYLENALTPSAFTAERVAVLALLASQAEISLENARLYSDLQRSEAFLAKGQSISSTGSFGWNVLSGDIHWSEETYRIFEFDRATRPEFESLMLRVHPEDRARVRETVERAARQRTGFDLEQRLLLPDGRVRHLHVLGQALEDSSGHVEFVGAVADVTMAKEVEAKIRQSESELRQLLDFTPLHITEFGPDGRPLYNNRAALDYHGLTLKEWQSADVGRLLHPQDAERMMREHPDRFASGTPYEMEARLRRRDGQYRWFLGRFNPVVDEQGRVTRWYLAATDIEDRKQAEQRLQNENVALRDEISSASMFEEIVGLSKAIKTVMQQVARVAPTDSTVLITGETGTGKELVARAIHKRSARSARPFVAVNCAAIPASLIASELFGHERGAFTGALQRRQGKFEIADGGTILLDEIGDLPSDTQVAILRVLQEREVERVGGSRPIRVDVRVIAATNRDLQAAIGERTFRSDLFYRLNVFPVEVPPLRERPTDIPLLVEYFVHRFSKRAGKRITGIGSETLELFQSYPWPGNIRELQNVIERAVILSDGDRLAVDARWMAGGSTQSPVSKQPLGDALDARERERAMIEAALAETKGRVSGPSGAAAKLGIPRSTLESRIRSLGLNKHRFKTN